MASVYKVVSSQFLCQRSSVKLTSASPWRGSWYSTAAEPASSPQKEYKFVVAGAGSGGMAMANALTRKFGKGKVAVVEPSELHFYQPMWTLVGGGIKTKEDSSRTMSSLMPKGADWYKDRVAKLDPDNNTVSTTQGDVLKYEYLIVALGFELNISSIKGMQEALDEDPMFCCNYSYNYVDKTFKAFQNFKKGNAIFTQPASPIKCAGAPQKIMYLAHDYFRKNGKLQDANIIFNQGLPKIFGVPKYAAVLTDICKSRDITVNVNHNLVEVRHDKKEAIFKLMDKETPEYVTYQYEMMHATPHMSPPEVLKSSPLAGPAGFMTVNKHTGQHTKYSNVVGLGDCTDIPTSRTAAAVAAQTGMLKQTLAAIMNNHDPEKVAHYDGYTSCPLITGYNTCVLAEFDFDLNPLETFPFDQGKERRTMYHLKKDFMPQLYWNMMVKGLWNGPGLMRKLSHFGFSK
ncbi:sulfide:quinone oxidoreductase, mitochondrial-like [Apostichopus japonicus]|uniref:sulfide:quinone oxidoreductase, mitochondrial-like n=1 Tax=Stichopus japonicus TaxID=307972 RepID=UPI003AB5F9A4